MCPGAESTIFLSDMLEVAENTSTNTKILSLLSHSIHPLCTFITECMVSARCGVKSFHCVLKTIMMRSLKYGQQPVICLSVNTGSRALKTHGLAADASWLTLCAAAMFNSCLCVRLTDSIPGESPTTAVTIMELEGVLRQ